MTRRNQPKIHHSRQNSIGTLAQHKRALVVHNGKITESQFLKKVKQDLPNGILTIKFCNGGISALIEEAIRLQGTAKRIDPYDLVYVMADVDDKYTQGDISKFRLQAMKDQIALLLSNPCIEVALSCYAENVTGNSRTIKGAQKEAIRNGLMCGRENKEIVLSAISDHFSAAKYAKGLSRRFDDFCPGTDVFKLIDDLKSEFQ